MTRAEVVSKYLKLGWELENEKNEERRFEIEADRENLRAYYKIEILGGVNG